MQFRSLFLPVAAALALTGCSGGGQQDSLTREKASMDQEAKAMASHSAAKPAPSEPKPAAGAAKSPASASGLKLPAGTLVKVVTGRAISSRTAATGEDWPGKLSEDLKAGGVVVAKAGSDAVGRVVLVSDGTGLRRKHELELRIYKITNAKGALMDLRTISIIQEGADAGKNPALIPANTPLSFQLGSETAFPQ